MDPPESTVWECHGTGTSLGDPIEVGAVRKVQIKMKRAELLGGAGAAPAKVTEEVREREAGRARASRARDLTGGTFCGSSMVVGAGPSEPPLCRRVGRVVPGVVLRVAEALDDRE